LILARAGRPLLLALLLALVAGGSASARAQAPLSVAVSPADGRPALSLRGVMRDAALREALQSGLPLRFHLRMELWQKGTFDRLVDREEVEAAVARSPLDPGYTLETARSSTPVATLAEAEQAVERALAVSLQASGRGRYYYLATLDVETLSLSDLEELRRWLRGEARPAVQGRAPVGRAVERGVRRFFVRLLGLPTRQYVAKSPFFTPR
jgi:hypothetical protein